MRRRRNRVVHLTPAQVTYRRRTWDAFRRALHRPWREVNLFRTAMATYGRS